MKSLGQYWTAINTLRSNVVSLVARQEEKVAESKHSAISTEEESQSPMVRYAKAEPTRVSQFSEAYVEVDFSDANFAINPDAFFDENYASTLSAMVDLVVNREAPLRDDVLARRIARAHGWLRTGSRIQDRVNQLAKRRYHFVNEGDLTFVWKSQSDMQEVRFRKPALGESRAVEEVAIHELIALARNVFESGIQQKLDGMSAMATKMGLQRLRTASRERLANAWDLAAS